MTPLTLGIVGFVIGFISAGISLVAYKVGIDYGVKLALDEIYRDTENIADWDDCSDFEKDDYAAEEVKNLN